MSRRTSIILALLAVLVSGCGSSGGDGSHPDYEQALAGAPAPLAALYKEGNELLPGGEDALQQRISSLRGYPVLANVWASWCGPCRFEFPALQEAAARFGKRVAFIGVDSQDSDEHAESFLSEMPVPYPSYSDPDEDVANSLESTGLPVTAIYDRAGDLCFVKRGPYSDHADLAADIRTYALEEGNCESG